MIDELRIAEAAGEGHSAHQPQTRGERFQPIAFFPFASDDGVNGVICDPTPQSIASALRRVMDDAPGAEKMGAAAFAAGAKLNWADTVAQLTGQ